MRRLLALPVLLALSLAACGSSSHAPSHARGVTAPYPSGAPAPSTAPQVHLVGASAQPGHRARGKYGSAATPYTGEVFTTTNGGWNNCGATGLSCTYTYAWTHSSGGAYTTASGSPTNTSSYTAAAGDVGDTLKVTVTATNIVGSASQTSAATGTVLDSTLPAHPGGGSWGLAFDDEFSGSSLDTSHWTVGWFGTGITKAPNGSNDYCADPANVSVSGGNLNLLLKAQAETCNGVLQPYAGALIYSNGTCGCGSGAGSFTYTYGVAEARVFFPASSGTTPANWPVWWQVGQVWPTNGEIDIAEGLGGCIAWHFHWGTSGSPQQTGGCASGSWGGGWHTFDAYWEPGVITYFYDGTQVATVTSNVTSSPLYMVLENGHGSFGGATSTPATMLVDYVRVWQ